MSRHVSTRLVHQHSHRYPMECLTKLVFLVLQRAYFHVVRFPLGCLHQTLECFSHSDQFRSSTWRNASPLSSICRVKCFPHSLHGPISPCLLPEPAPLPLDMPFLLCYPLAVPLNTSPASKRSRRTKLPDYASDVTRHCQQSESCEHAHAL